MSLSSVDSSATTVFEAPAMLSFSKSATVTKPLSLQYHIVLHLDKNCAIDEMWRKNFYKYIAGCLRALKCDLEAIGGAGDHLHLLVNLNSTDALADVVRRLKLLSQSWVRRGVYRQPFAERARQALHSQSKAASPAFRLD